MQYFKCAQKCLARGDENDSPSHVTVRDGSPGNIARIRAMSALDGTLMARWHPSWAGMGPIHVLLRLRVSITNTQPLYSPTCTYSSGVMYP